MKTIHFVHVEIPAGPLLLTRKFWFSSVAERDTFIRYAKDAGYEIGGYGIEHLLSPATALAECAKEAESV